jgi:phage baseplate assembly protein W
MAYVLVTDNVGNQSLQPLGVGLNFQNTELFQSVINVNEQVTNNLKNLLLTKIGERVGQPTFGCDLLYILFEPNINDIKDDIKTFITTPVAYWLPYINIIDIVINTAQDNPNLQHDVEIKIVFSIDETNIQILNIATDSTGTITTTTENGI